VNVPVCNYMYKTLPVLGRCMPYLTYDEMTALFSTTSCASPPCGSDDLSEYFSGPSEFVSTLTADLAKCWYVVLAASGFALVWGLLFLVFMKYCATCVIFTGLVMVITGLSLITLVFYYVYTELKKTTEITPQLDSYDNDVLSMQICLGVTIAFAAIDAIVVCIVLCMCKQIRVACKVLELAADGVMDMPVLIAYPVLEALMLCGGLVIWMYGAVYIATAGDISQNEVYGYGEFAYDDTLKGMAAYWLFGLLWITEFATSVGFMVVAMCFCIWFFTEKSDENNKIPVRKFVHYEDPEEEGELVWVSSAPPAPDDSCCCCLPACPWSSCCCCCSPSTDKGEPKQLNVKPGGMGEANKSKMDELSKKEELSDVEEQELTRLRDRKKEVDLLNLQYEAEYNAEMGGKSVGSGTGRLMPSCILGSAVKCTLLHHLGTLAFGSLIVAIINFLRIILEYIEQKQKELGAEPPFYWKFIFCCLRCCLWCLAQCMRFLNKNAYILTCINGSDFCTSACHAAVVLVSNMDYVFITVSITSGMLVFGKLAIALFTAAVGGYWCSQIDGVSSILVPTLIMVLIGYTISMLFMQVYEMGIDTVLMCFFEAKWCSYPPKNLPDGIRDFVSSAQDTQLKQHAEKKKNTPPGQASEQPQAQASL